MDKINLVIGNKDIVDEIELSKIYHYIKNDIYPPEVKRYLKSNRLKDIIQSYHKLSSIPYTQKKIPISNNKYVIGFPSFTFNVFNDTRHGDNLKYYTNCFGLDIDIDKEQIDKTKLDPLKDADIYENIFSDLKILIRNLKHHSILIKKSSSKTGLHIILKFNMDLELNKDKYSKIHQGLQKFFRERIKNLQLNYNYVIDNTSDVARMFILNYDPDIYFNEENYFEYLFGDDNEYELFLKNYVYQDQNDNYFNSSINNYNILKTNSKLLNRFLEIKNSKGSDEHKRLLSFIKHREYSYGEGELLFLCKNLDDVGRREMFYIFKQFYKDSSTFKPYYSKPFKEFSKFIDGIKKKEGSNQVSLKWFFRGSKIDGLDDTIGPDDVILKDENLDIFGYRYTKVIKLSEKYIEDFDYLKDKKGKKFINAGTGLGKTTCAVKYLNKLTGVKIFVCPTNLIIKQTVKKCEELNINSNPYYAETISSFKLSDNDLIITNYQNLNSLSVLIDTCSCVVIDECHKLTDYANFDKDNRNIPIKIPEADQHIYLSATPEHFIIGNEDFEYIRYINNLELKRNIILVYFKSVKKMYDVIGGYMKNRNKIQIIYNNDKDENKKYKDYLKEKYNLDLDLISSEDKNAQYKNIINTSKLKNSIITTSILNDGVNILNDEGDIESVFIIDNNTQSFFDLYQFSSRFRTSQPNIYVFRRIYKDEDFEFRKRNLKEYFELEYNRKLGDYNSDLEMINSSIGLRGIDLTQTSFVYKDGPIYKINENLIKYDIVSDFTTKIQNSYKDYPFYISYFFNIIKTIFNSDDNGVFKKPVMKDLIKDFIFKYYDNYIILGDAFKDILKTGLEGLEVSKDEIDLYKKYKGTIKTYMNRLNKIKGFEGSIPDNIFLDNKKFERYTKSLVVKELRKKKELSKQDRAVMNDVETIDSIIQMNNSLEYFKAEIVKYKLLKYNIIDISSTRRINRDLNILGYKLKRKNSRLTDKVNKEYYIIRC